MESAPGRNGVVVAVIQLAPLLVHAYLARSSGLTAGAPFPLCNGDFESPYHRPLVRYLSKHVEATINYFLDKRRMGQSNYFSLFLDLVRSPEGEPLLQGLLDRPGRLLEHSGLAASLSRKPSVTNISGSSVEAHMAHGGGTAPTSHEADPRGAAPVTSTGDGSATGPMAPHPDLATAASEPLHPYQAGTPVLCPLGGRPRVMGGTRLACASLLLYCRGCTCCRSWWSCGPDGSPSNPRSLMR